MVTKGNFDSFNAAKGEIFAFFFSQVKKKFVGHLRFILSPFTWDNARIAIDCEAQAAAKVLADWFEEAFSERGGADNQSLLGVAHEISDPLVEGATSIALIDFGSVDIALVIDLFDRLGAAGASRVELSLPEV